MKLKEVLQKVQENLSVEEDLKNQIKNTEVKVELNKKKLNNMQDKLVEGYASYDELKAKLIGELNLKAESIDVNLDSFFHINEENENVLCLEFKFMGNKYSLVSENHTKTNNEELHDLLDYSSPVEGLFNKYLENGDKVLNAVNVAKLQEIAALYSKNPKLVTSKFETIKKEKLVKSFEEKLKSLYTDFNNNINELEKIEDKLEKAKVFKSALAKKLFSRREKLEEKQNILLDKTDNIDKSIKAIEMELADKSEIENDSKIYVNNEIQSLHTVLSLIKDFEVAKFMLFSEKNKHIIVKSEIEKITKTLLQVQNQLEDLKDMFKLNKKVNKETISMALKDKQFLNEINAANPNKISKANEKAFNLLQTKYGKKIEGEIKKLI